MRKDRQTMYMPARTLPANSICNSSEAHVGRRTARAYDEPESSPTRMCCPYPRIEATHVPITRMSKLALSPKHQQIAEHTGHCLCKMVGKYRVIFKITVMVTCVDDPLHFHFSPSSSGHVFVNPIWLVPVLFRNYAERDLAVCHDTNTSGRKP
jgi:hypothetical protein